MSKSRNLNPEAALRFADCAEQLVIKLASEVGLRVEELNSEVMLGDITAYCYQYIVRVNMLIFHNVVTQLLRHLGVQGSSMAPAFVCCPYDRRHRLPAECMEDHVKLCTSSGQVTNSRPFNANCLRDCYVTRYISK